MRKFRLLNVWKRFYTEKSKPIKIHEKILVAELFMGSLLSNFVSLFPNSSLGTQLSAKLYFAVKRSFTGTLASQI